MSAFPPPYAPREHAQVQSSSHGSSLAAANADAPLEFAESTSVCLEWRLTGLKQMYDSTKGDVKSKCIKSAVFGDADNLWEVLWYANSGVQGGEYASLYLSCVPTAQERDQSIGGKWKRTGVWFFRFEIKSLVPDERSNKIITLATKDAADHTFAVKTANWGWQQFAKRDGLFLHPTVQMADGFLILCTIQAQPQPPAGYWLGMGIPPSIPQPAMMNVGGRNVGSGGGLSAWSGGSGASGGVAGGVAAGGGIKRVVPKDLVSAVGSMLDDPLYSDVEFVFPRKRSNSRDDGGAGREDGGQGQKRIFANKKLLLRHDYFQAMFEGGFREVEGVMDLDGCEDDEVDMLSDSDAEDEGDESLAPATGLHLTTTTSHVSDTGAPSRGPSPPASAPHSNDGDHDDESQAGDHPVNRHGAGAAAEGHADEAMEDVGENTPSSKRQSASGTTAVTPPARHTEGGPVLGPKKVKVVINDAAWSTWWALLYWIYTDTVYFAPLTSSFPIGPSSRQQSHARLGSTSSIPPTADAPNRREWIKQWLEEHNIGNGDTGEPIGPRPVSAKAMYRLADKLDLQSLKLRAFQHICSQLTVQNIPAEVFSRFSSTFEDVRRVQVAFFLKHWSEIKKSDTMTQIWQQIRTGKHVGFEEVWPLIVGQLEFKQS